MNKCWTVALVAILLLPNLATSADVAKDAYAKGKSCLDKKDYDAAIPAFAEAIRLDPTNADAYCGRGLAYVKKGEPDKAKAEEDFAQAKKLGYKAK